MKKTILLFFVLIISCNNQIELTDNFTLDEIKDGVIYEVNIRQYSESGHFNEFTKDIPKLRELGVKILWLMPIHPISKSKRKGTLGSYYSISDYKEVNPEFGNKEDLDRLVNEAHKHDMLVILDWVANHTGWDHSWIKSNPEFYTKNEDGEITDPINPSTGESWGWTDVADLNFDNMDMQNKMIDAMEYWVKEHDIDGYRADAAHSCPPAFWKKSIDRLKKIKNVLMLAESDGYHPGGFELIELFDMSYNWSGHHELNKIAKKENNLFDLYSNINRNIKDYSSEHILMNFTSNHDENTWAGTVFDRYGEGVKTFAALTYFLPGMPLIYNGQEYGSKTRLEFFEKDSIEKQNKEYFEFYKKLNQIKKDNKALHISKETEFEILDISTNNTTFLKRTFDGNEIYFIANLSDEPEMIYNITGDFSSLNTGNTLNFNEGFNIKPWEYHFLLKNNL